MYSFEFNFFLHEFVVTLNLEFYSDWKEWSSCSVCGKKGEQRRRGKIHRPSYTRYNGYSVVCHHIFTKELHGSVKAGTLYELGLRLSVFLGEDMGPTRYI